MTEPDWLDEIEGRLNAATPGPWEAYDANEGTQHAPMWSVANEAFHNPPADENEPWIAIDVNVGVEADAEFIAHAPEAISWLLARVRELEAERPELWDEGLRAGMDSVLTAHERLADSRADWLPLVPTNPYREVSDGSE